jgi:hypothetical protein
VMISTSWEIPNTDADDMQPPHLQTYRRYKETADSLDADLVVTMEHPSKKQPKRTVVTLDGNGPTLIKSTESGPAIITSNKSPRMG